MFKILGTQGVTEGSKIKLQKHNYIISIYVNFWFQQLVSLFYIPFIYLYNIFLILLDFYLFLFYSIFLSYDRNKKI